MDWILTDLPIYAAAGLPWPAATHRSVTVPQPDTHPSQMGFGNIELIANHRLRPAFHMLHNIEAQSEFSPGELRSALSHLESYVSSPAFRAGPETASALDPDRARKIEADTARLTTEARAHFLDRVDRLRANAGPGDPLATTRPFLALPGATNTLSRLLAEHIAVDYADHEIVDNGLGGRAARKVTPTSAPKNEQKAALVLFRAAHAIITPKRKDFEGLNRQVNQIRSDTRKAPTYGTTNPHEIRFLQSAVRLLADLAAVDVSPVPPTASASTSPPRCNRDTRHEGSSDTLARARRSA